jgi:uncharacterized short protein YbdD (DUF466 family)
LKIDYLDKTLDDTFVYGDKVVEVSDYDVRVKALNEWLHEADELHEEIAEKIEEQFNADFHDYPGTLYHVTDSDNVESILADGLEASSRSRGLTNRSVGAAIFTFDSLDAIDDAYGDAVLAIDVAAMQRDGINYHVSQEPSVSKYEADSLLAAVVGAQDYEPYVEHDGADNPATVILYVGNVPPKYLKEAQQRR